MAHHEKWVLQTTRTGTADFADWYQFGGSQPCPLIHYTGGSISAESHAQRFGTEPTPIVREFERAWATAGAPRVDLLISCSPPFGAEVPADRLTRFADHVLIDLVTRLPTAPVAFGFVGYSLGGHYATALAALAPAARALAVFGGAGVVEAAAKTGTVQAEDLETLLFRNRDDLLFDPRVMAQQLPAAFHAQAADFRAGAHPYVDYADNQTVADAFAFVLRRLATAR